MPYEFIPIALGILFIFGLVGFGLVRKALTDKERLQVRQMLHRERLAALEKGLPIDEIKLEDSAIPELGVSAGRSETVAWMRFTALFLGLAFFFGGIGMSVGFRVAPEPGFNGIWSLGLIPTLTGLGLLIFYFMTIGWQNASAAR